MASLQSLQQRNIAKRLTVVQSNVNKDVALRLHYIGTGSVTSVTVTTATDITFITSDGGTDQYTWAAFTTLGALCDAINKDGIFEAKILDGLRSEATEASKFVDGAISSSDDGNETVYDLLWATNGGTVKRMAARLTMDRTFATKDKLLKGHRVTLKEIATSFTLGGGADTNAMKIYECTKSDKGETETLLLQRTPTSGSAVEFDWANGEGGITGKDGSDIVVFVTDGTSFDAAATMSIAGILE